MDNPMTYKQALAHVRTQKISKTFLVLCFNGQHCQLILPYKEGITVLQNLESAEQLSKHDFRFFEDRISPLKKETINVWTLSGEEYERHKVALLLDIEVSNVKPT